MHLRNIFDIKPSRSNISGHQYSSVSLFEVFQGLLSVTLLPAMKILFFNTFLYVRIQPIYKYNVFCYNCAIANTSKLVFVSPKQSKTLTPDTYLSPWIHWQLIILRDRSLDKSSALKNTGVLLIRHMCMKILKYKVEISLLQYKTCTCVLHLFKYKQYALFFNRWSIKSSY